MKRILPLLAAAVAAAVPGESHPSDQEILNKVMKGWFLNQGGLGEKPILSTYETFEHVEFSGAFKFSFEVHVTRTRTGLFRIETSNGGPGTVQAFDGRLGWQARPPWGVSLYPGVRRGAWAWSNNLMTPFDSFRPHIDIMALKGREQGGVECIVAAVSDANRLNGRLFFNRSDLTLRRIEIMPSASSADFSADYGDYRKVDGLRIPFLMTVTGDGTVAVHHRTKVLINPKIDMSQFVLSTAEVEEATEVASVLDRHEKSIGDESALNRIYTRVMKLTVEVPALGTTYAETISQKAPNKILVEIDTPGMGRETRGYDGITGWMNSELQGYRPLSPAEIAALAHEGTLQTIVQLAQGSPFRRMIGDQRVGDRNLTALSLAGYQGPMGTFYFDKETGRLLRVGLPVSGDRESNTESTVDYSDFRMVDGIETPFEMVRTNSMQRTVSKVLSVDNNVPLSDSIFLPRQD